MNCMECGACCQILKDIPGYVGCSAEEAVGLKVVETDTYRSLETIPIPGGFRCYALEGEVGKSVRCTIYENRPAVCRSVNPGGITCMSSRAEAGLG